MKTLGIISLIALTVVLTGCVAHHSDVWGSWALDNCQGNTCTVTFNSDNTVNFFGAPTTYSWDSDHVIINPAKAGDAPIIYNPSVSGDELELDGTYEVQGKTTHYFGFKLHKVVISGQH